MGKIKRRIKIEDIIFWIIIFLIIAVAIWLLYGSPTEIGALIAIATFTAASELLIWKFIFNLDKEVAISFMKVKHDIDKLRIEINIRFDNIEDKLNTIKIRT